MEHPRSAAVALYCLHFLGGSARTWSQVLERLPDGIRGIALDLPGFGGEAARPGFSVHAMADGVAARIRADAPGRWAIAGHSMGAKVALAVARRAEDGEHGLGGLAAIVTLAGSPPGPEPIDEDQRRTMLTWFAGGETTARAEASGYIAQNTATPFDDGVQQTAVEDVLRANPDSWRAWLEFGSREDWVARIGTVQTRGLIISGTEDPALGPTAQARLMAPHFADARHVTLQGAKHLLPTERPDEVAALIAEQLLAPPIGGAYRALIESERVSDITRTALLDRARPDQPGYVPAALTTDEFRTLRTVLDRVIPQSAPAIDLAARIDRRLAEGGGDGWRYARLPPDPAAYQRALRTLGDRFTGLDRAGQTAALQRIADGQGQPGELDAEQMRLWFEDLRSEATRLFVAHPATLARMGYSGIAYGGDGPDLPGFTQVGAGDRERWEPAPAA